LLRGSLASLVDPRDERLIHRLLAFSDIVIGFSMVLLAINLQPNATGVDGAALLLIAFFIGPFDDRSYMIVVPLALASVVAEKMLTPRIVGKAPAS
jgi:hypothetical protein